MPPSPEPNGTTFTLDDAMAWLAQPANPDPLGDLIMLRRSLLALARAEVPPTHRLRIVDIFIPRLLATHEAVLSILLESALPLSRALGNVTRAMTEIHGLTADILLDAALGSTTVRHNHAWRSVSRICNTALTELQRKLNLSLIAFGQVPEEVWAGAMTAVGLNQRESIMATSGCFGQMLALSAAQPESFTPRELNFLRTVLGLFDEPVDLSESPPADGLPFFWLDTESDAPPVASTRQAPPDSTHLLFFRFSTLLNALDPVLAQLESGTPASQLGMPRESNHADYLNALQRARQLLANPLRRQFPRRRQHYGVRVCVRLSELWGLLQQNEKAGQEISGWTVINKSPDGCALEHASGNISGLIAGGALGMRESENTPWSVCLIRWVRGGTSEHIELGLEFMAPQAMPVRIISGDAANETLPGLLLPALPKLNRRESLLVGRGRRWEQEFSMVIETDGKVMLANCRPAAIVHQTSSVEIFEFDRLRTPD